MPIVPIIVTLVVIGLLLWIVNTYIPMDEKIKSILNVVVLILVVLWLVNIFIPLGTLGNVQIRR